MSCYDFIFNHRDSLDLYRSHDNSSQATASHTHNHSSATSNMSNPATASTESGFSPLHLVPTWDLKTVKAKRSAHAIVRRRTEDSDDSLLLHTVATDDLPRINWRHQQHDSPRRPSKRERLHQFARKLGHHLRVAGHHIREALTEPIGDIDMDNIHIGRHSFRESEESLAAKVAEYKLQKLRYRQRSIEELFGQTSQYY